MTTLTLFDLDSGLAKRDAGMKLAADKKADLLALARVVARDYARKHGEVHADNVGRILKAEHGVDSLGAAAGSLFKGQEWVFTGRRCESARATNHGRELKVWRLRHV